MAKQARELMDYNNTLSVGVQNSIRRYSEFVNDETREAFEGSEYADLLKDATDLSQFIPTLFIKLGARGVLAFQRSVSGGGGGGGEEEGHLDVTLRWKKFPAYKVESMQSVTGAGDRYSEGFLTSLLFALDNFNDIWKVCSPTILVCFAFFFQYLSCCIALWPRS